MKQLIMFVIVSTVALTVFQPTAGHAAISVSCIEGCGSREDDRTVNPLYLRDEASPITLEWLADSDPASDDAAVRLYAGNPAFADVIPDLGAVTFAQSGANWRYTRTFPVASLGKGTFLTVLVRETRRGRLILDWRAFRLLSESTLTARANIETAGGNWSVDISPALLQVSSGHGDLPRSTGGDERVWWSLWAGEGDVSDADIDGSDTGVAGLGIQVSTPWRAREDWRDRIVANLTGVDGHTTKFGELTWNEVPDRELSLGAGQTRIDIRNYYTIVTMHTNASIKAFSAVDVGRTGNERFYSHETSANLKPPKDPRFWSSYTRRDFSADKSLLDLLQKQVAQSAVPGAVGVQTADGDGGSAVYRVGLVASARPWGAVADDDSQKFVAGFVGIDVVAARAGLGKIQTGDGGDAGSALVCQLLRCDSEDKNLDLNDPPRGYTVAQPVASLETISGKLPMTEGTPVLAQREGARDGEPSSRLPILPSQTRFAVAANLRSGALIRKGGIFGTRVENIVPINSYAQFVIKMTVATLPDSDLVVNTEMIAPNPDELDVITKAPPKKGVFDWLGDFLNITPFARFALIAVIVLALVLLVPGFRKLIGALLNFFAALINRLAESLDKGKAK